MTKQKPFFHRLILAVALGGICTAVLLLFAFCGGATASAGDVEERSRFMAEGFSLRYGNGTTDNEQDIEKINGDGVADRMSAFTLTAKQDLIVLSLTVVTEKLDVEVFTVETDDEPDFRVEITAMLGDTGFSAELSTELDAGRSLFVIFPRELSVQAIFANYQTIQKGGTP